MLRTRLFLGLLTLVLLLWAVGAAGLLILREASGQVETRLKQDYRAIDIANGFRAKSSLLNNNYLTTLAEPPQDPPPDRELFDSTRGEFSEHLSALRRLSDGNERWAENLKRLSEAIALYEEGYERMLSGSVVDPQERSELLKAQGNRTQRITDLCESLASLAEERLFASSEALSKQSGKNTAFIATFVVLGTGIAVLIYFQLLRHLVDPVLGLRDSIEEVSKGNFELTLPAPAKGSEFSPLVAAFNSMAAELGVSRRETDQRLLRNNLVNRALLSAIPSPVYVLDDAGGIVQLNPAAEALNENLGLGGRLPGKVRRHFAGCRETGTNLMPEDPREALLFRVADEERYYLPRIFHFDGASGDDSGWAVLLHDVTRIRWLDDMKTNMLSTVSHEIKTPLTGIRMVLHLLLEEQSGRLEPMQRTMLRSASDDCERLLTTLNTLLDLSRAESGTTHLERSPLDLREAAGKSASLFASKARTNGVGIRVESDGDLPPVMADPMRLREVIHNLVSNAVKHSPSGGEIEVRLSRNGSDFVRLSVIDEGPGVPEDSQDRIFERFYRAPGQVTDGVGLGLYISREIMRAHEGRIGLQERNGTYNHTEFFIDVPIA